MLVRGPQGSVVQFPQVATGGRCGSGLHAWPHSLPLPAAAQLEWFGHCLQRIWRWIQSGHSDQILERVVKAQLWLWLLVQM